MYEEQIHKQIEAIAYELWEKAGKPESDGIDFFVKDADGIDIL